MKYNLQLVLVITLSLTLGKKTSKVDLDKIWAPNPEIPPENLPIQLNEAVYDDIVVDPMTNDIYPGKPWFILFYSRQCHWCQEFKKDFETLSNDLQIIARWGMVDAQACESLSLTYNIDGYPTMVLLYNGMVYQYDGYRTYDSIKAFINRDHIYIKKQFEIPPRIGALGMQLKYLERSLPKYEKKLDELIFTRLGYQEMERNQKFMIVIGAAVNLVIFGMIALCCCCCCRKKKVQKTTEKKPPSKSSREKID